MAEQGTPQDQYPLNPLQDSMFGINDDQLVEPTAYLDQETQQEDYNTDKAENLKTIKQMVQLDTPQEQYPLNPSGDSMLGVNDDQTTLLDPEMQQGILDTGINSQIRKIF